MILQLISLRQLRLLTATPGPNNTLYCSNDCQVNEMAPSNSKLFQSLLRNLGVRASCMRAYFNTALFRSDQLALQDKIYGITGITPYSVTCMHK